MKKIYLLLFVVFAFNLANAQRPRQFQITQHQDKKLENFYKIDSIQKANQERRTLVNNSKGLEWMWDTIKYYDVTDSYFKRSIQTYYTTGNIHSHKTQQLNGTSWNLESKDSFNYDVNGNLSSLFLEHWDWSNNTMLGAAYIYYTYFSNGMISSAKVDEFNNSNQITSSTRYSYLYDSSGNEISNIQEDSISSGWKYSIKYDKSYNSNGEMLSNQLLFWINGNWVNQHKYIFEYNASGNKISSHTFNFLNNAWNCTEIHRYSYDMNSNLLESIDSFQVNGVMELSCKDIYTYNNFNKITSHIYQDYLNNIIYDQDKYEYIYDGNLNNTIEQLYSWEYNNWQIRIRITSTYNQNHLQLTLKEEYWDDYSWLLQYKYFYAYSSTGKLLTKNYETYYNGTLYQIYSDSLTYNSNDDYLTSKFNLWTNNQWTHSWNWGYNPIGEDSLIDYSSYKIHYLYDPVNSFNSFYICSFISIFPNPAQNSISIECPKTEKESFVTIYNLSGQKLFQQTFSGNRTQIDISTLKSGIYLVEVRNDNMVEVKKVVKE